MTDKLKPCPFCGKRAHTGHQVSKHKDDEYYLVMCAYCFARTVGETLDDAITAWNNRVPATDQCGEANEMVREDKICGVTKLTCAYCNPVCTHRKEANNNDG